MEVLKHKIIDIKAYLENHKYLSYGMIVFVLLSLIIKVDISFLLLFIFWLSIMAYSLFDLKNRLLLFIFTSSFFVFLIGGHFVYEYFGLELKHYLGYEYYLHSNITMLVSLIFVLLGFLMNNHLTSKKLKLETKRRKLNSFFDLPNINLIKLIAKFLFYITFIASMIILLDKVVFVIQNSYHQYYVNYRNTLPFIINVLGNMNIYFFYIFLATLPSKRETIFIFSIQLLYASLSLFTGRRTDFVITVVFLMFYFGFRHFKSEKKDWINRKYIIRIIYALPVFFFLLYIFNFIRLGLNPTSISLNELFFGFFQQQGFSSSVIRLGLYHKDSLRHDAFYSFFGLVKYFRTNSLFLLFYKPNYNFSYIGNSIDFALYGNSLAHSLSYIVLRNYLSGFGVGSSYIAELYHDFGYFGIIFGNLIYGVIISKISALWMKTKTYNIWIMAVSFSLIESFLKAPRWNFDIIFTQMISLGMWSSIFSVIVLYFIIQFLENKYSILTKYLPNFYKP